MSTIVKKARKQLSISQEAFKCAEKLRADRNRSFNNFIETLILEECKRVYNP